MEKTRETEIWRRISEIMNETTQGINVGSLLKEVRKEESKMENYVLTKDGEKVPVLEKEVITRSGILSEAKKCICGNREEDYGSPEDNFNRIAALWSAYFDKNFTAKDVAMAMSLMKIARIKAGTKSDSYIDLAGYAACAGEIESYNEYRKKNNL
jgi:hypothetical protein